MKNVLRPLLLKSFVTSAAFFSACSYNNFPEPVDCSVSDLSISLDVKKDPTTCNSIDGSITVSATGGEGPYGFSLNAGGIQTTGVFATLGPGSYTLAVTDNKGCSITLMVDLNSSNSTLTATASVNPDSDCFSDNGSITINASLGKPPYRYQFGTGSFGDVSTFSNLKPGNYTVAVKDGDDCPKLLNVTVPRSPSSISFATDIKPILDANCNTPSCHNGSLGSARDWRTYPTIKTNAASIKTRTVNKTMPPGTPLTQKQIDQITCWVDDGALDN